MIPFRYVVNNDPGVDKYTHEGLEVNSGFSQVYLDYLGGSMGIPKLWLLPLLVPNPSNLYPKLENFTTQNLKLKIS